jgi:outer membrane protein assembly factor BamA
MRFCLPFLVAIVSALPAEAATVRIEGLPPGEAARVLERMEPRLEFVRARPPTPWRARDAAWLCERVLVESGYRDAVVRERWQGDTITLEVLTRKRHSLARVEVEGVAAREARRLAALVRSVSSARESALGPLSWREGDTEAAMGLLVSDFQSRGYWKPDVRLIEENVAPDSGATTLRLAVASGPRFTIAEPQIAGDTGLDAGALRALVARQVGQTADTGNLNAVRSTVESALSAAGFQFATVHFSPLIGDSTFTPVLFIHARSKFSFGGTRVFGLDRTKPSRIESLYATLGHGPFNAAAIDAIDTRLMATGAFSSIHRELMMNEDGTIDLDITFTEARARGFALTAGAGSYEGMILGGSWYDRNADGRLGGYSIGAEWSQRGIHGIWRWTQPMFPGLDDSLTGRLAALTRDHEGYDTQQFGGEFGWSRRFGTKGTITASFLGSYVDSSADGLPEAEMGPTNYEDFAGKIGFRWIEVDNPVSPNRGWQAGASLISGVLSEGGEYRQIEADASWIHPIGDNDWLAARGSLGSIGGPSVLPVDKRLFLGGANSVRSFPERELGPLAEGYPRGGEGFWSASLEHQHRLAGPLKSVLFADAGALAVDPNPFSAEETEFAVGLGLRLDLPIGPIRFEYGHNLTRDEGEPGGAFHFAIGLKF